MFDSIPRAIDEALERLGVLIALRKAPEAAPQGTPEIYMGHWPAELIAPPHPLPFP